MTKQEAVEILTAYRKNAENIYRVNEDTGTVEGHTVAFDMAIEALEQEPSCRNLRQVDLISRQDAIDVLETVGYDFSASELSEIELEEVCEVVGDVRQDMINGIKRMTSAQQSQNLFCALADRECPFQGKEFAWCLTCPHISEEDRALVKKFASEPKHGRWVADRKNQGGFTPGGNSVKSCSLCGWIYGAHRIVPDYNYCPNCGADMRGEEE